MPTETAAICPVSGHFCCFSGSKCLRSASDSATQAPVIDAVRVPPSAPMTSQSTSTLRSPSFCMSTTERSARPISRWISCVRPPSRPLAASRWLRSGVACGSIAYSAVTQPVPRPRIHGGTRSSIVAAQITRVSPSEISTLPSANGRYPGSNARGRS